MTPYWTVVKGLRRLSVKRLSFFFAEKPNVNVFVGLVPICHAARNSGDALRLEEVDSRPDNVYSWAPQPFRVIGLALSSIGPSYMLPVRFPHFFLL